MADKKMSPRRFLISSGIIDIKPEKQTDAAFKAMSHYDKMQTNAEIQHGSTKESSVKRRAGSPGAYTTEKPDAPGVFIHTQKGKIKNINTDKKKKRGSLEADFINAAGRKLGSFFTKRN